MDHRFHRSHKFFARRRSDLGIHVSVITTGHGIEYLHDYLQGLAHLLQPHLVPREHISIRSCWYIELVLLDARIRESLSDVPGDTCRSQDGACYPERKSLFLRDLADTYCALTPDGVVGQQALVLLQLLGKDRD